MSSFINIQVTFDKLYQFNLIRENLTWLQLATVIQTSIIAAARDETLTLYYKSNDLVQTLSNQAEFSRLLQPVTNEVSGLRLYQQSQENMEPVYMKRRSNDAFKKLSDFAQAHYDQLENNPCLSKMVGFLAARAVYAPEKNVDAELKQIQDCINHGSTMNKEEFRRLMKERKMMRKHGHCKMFKRRENQDDESFEFVASDPDNEENGKCNRRRRHGRRHRGEHVDVPFEDVSSSEKKEHHEEKHGDSSSSDSDSGNEGGRCGRRRGGRYGRRGKHHPFGPATEFYAHFNGHGHHGRHGRHGFGGSGFEGPGGSGFEGEHGFGGRHHPLHENFSDFDFSHFNRKGHHGRHWKKHGGEKYFVFA